MTPPKTQPVPHRTPTERLYDLALAQAQRPKSDPVSTVSLTLNAKGETQITVDVDDVDPATAAVVASKIFDGLVAKYPRTNGA